MSKSIKKSSKMSARKGALVFILAFAAIGGAFMTFKSFAATSSGSTLSGKDVNGCPYDWSQRPTLRAGARGGCVWTLQGDLIRWGSAISLDGQYGPQTTAAVYSFQRTYGLPQDGVTGPQTWANIVLRIPER